MHELLGMSLTYDRIWMLDQHSSIISEDLSLVMRGEFFLPLLCHTLVSDARPDNELC